MKLSLRLMPLCEEPSERSLDPMFSVVTIERAIGAFIKI